jgi:hypothetical protein
MKAAESGGSGYVVQMGAFREQKTARQMMNRLRSRGIEVSVARKENGMHVVLSQGFATREKARDLAVWLVASALIDSYIITGTQGAVVSRSSTDHAALAATASDHLRNGRHEAAYQGFAELSRLEPGKAEHLAGMIDALAGMEEFEKALELAPAVHAVFYSKHLVSQE